jgi:hypothetical protein
MKVITYVAFPKTVTLRLQCINTFLFNSIRCSEFKRKLLIFILLFARNILLSATFALNCRLKAYTSVTKQVLDAFRST